MKYNNALLTITSDSTADPFILCRFDKFYLTFTAGSHIEIWCSPHLGNFQKTCTRHSIWRPPPDTPYSGDLWAPELHALNGRWYVYFAADDPKHGNPSHRMFVLGGPPSHADPCAGPWEFLGHLRGLPNQWAIDGTVIELDGKNYFVYSGWPLGDHSGSHKVQELFIARMFTPTECDESRLPTRISTPDRRWEWSGQSGINEGPQELKSPHDGGRQWSGIVYSCAGSWTKDYKVNTIQWLGGDPLDVRNWRKGNEPLLQNSRGHGPYGPGHGNFITLDTGDMVSVFHATDNPTDGWNGRKARVQRVVFTQDGPHMGKVVGRQVGTIEKFLEDVADVIGSGGSSSSLKDLGRDILREFKVVLKKF
ncbi:glycoside hydrolase family 43 protein [Aulographum hederae CBS 113979]|uniref:Glycoside hydrolase family 43 protein n=1 Tax=Aulographum hederae CBS 113979 TaxID=1176131 RepID=A0A6G1H2B9_9PEZI|nr:glycoside hydrolase family 43 protein [Aulographum hederae CBS 113979]